jgi:aspartyl/glutamyl-tRNA(Asn/Gln) amidotransferase C subunit
MITGEDFDKIAEYALINFTAKEKAEILKDMSEVINLANKVKEAETNMPPYKGRIIKAQELRDDIPEDCTPVDILLQNAGGGEDGFFVIKRRGKNE